MKKRMLSIIAVCLVLSMLTGCSMIQDYFDRLSQLLGFTMTDFSDMEYTRPDMDAFREGLEQCCADAEKETNLRKMQQIILDFYELYEDFYTSYALAMIHYSKDLTNTYWEAENAFCTEHTAEVDAGLDRLYRVLAKSSLREELEGENFFGPGFFDDYEGESIYDDTFNAMLTREAELVNRYYAVSAEASSLPYYSDEYFRLYGSQMEMIFLELVQVRQEMTAYAGYDSYPEFAYDFHHVRDYTVEQARDYLQQIKTQLVPLYRQLNTSGYWNIQLQPSTEQETFAYVQTMANQMGGVIQTAFDDMVDAGLYDIAYGENKFDASFTMYIYSYSAPYVFVNPTMTEYDKLTFTHEFGHFANQYVSYGGQTGVDVAEVFSQGLEYLSLCYVDAGGNLEKIRMATCLTTYVEQAAYAAFEHQVYGLTGDALTVGNIRAIYQSVGEAYGFDSWAWDSRDYVCITHFFTSPLYVISYVVSNDAALQLYQLEQAEAGAGLQRYVDHLATGEAYFLAFLESADLQSPFAPGRLEEVKKTLEAILQ